MPATPQATWWPRSLSTPRLHLRPVEPGDVPVHSRMWTDAEVRRHLGGPVDAEVVRARERLCVGAPGLLSIVRRADDEVLGSVLVQPDARDGRTEVSYQLLPEHWGHGYAREAVTAVADWATAAAPGRDLVAVTQEANTRSRRLLEALGATLAERFVEFGRAQVLYRLPTSPR
ncbi:GNAT family N-acetyltransferase [Streptomyces gilvifuscus]|uniref:GNAT family N-acetyltransferase n=1 Tax=Streptomyces gilvifuscus TaxID=1550617 RepID=A0ABT5FK68_9ACTN|nr:GNAT family N-acetyltransferase [Streptomyces gilvifuscus]MDC2952913.1 GNAT family N-acetyltransferase [Streptomyces gilvifuscus]